MRHSLRSCGLFLGLLGGLATTALADQNYSFHESVHLGDRMLGQVQYEDKTVSAKGSDSSAPDGPSTTKQNMKLQMTVTAVKDGSATAMQVEVDPSSFSSEQSAGQAEVKTPSPFAGQKVTLTRGTDEKVTNNFKGKATDAQSFAIAEWLNPDQDFFPSTPVAVGDMWDAGTLLAKHSDLDAKDQICAKIRLDSVNTVNGKQIANFTVSQAVIRLYEGNLEGDDVSTIHFQVDVSRSQIIASEITGVIHYLKLPDKLGIRTTPSWDVQYTAHSQIENPPPATTRP